MNSDRSLGQSSKKHCIWRNSQSLINFLASCPAISKNQFAEYWGQAIQAGDIQSLISLLKYLNIIRQTCSQKHIKKQSTQNSNDVTKIKMHMLFGNCLDLITFNKGYLKQFTNLMLEFSEIFFLAIHKSNESIAKLFKSFDYLIRHSLQICLDHKKKMVDHSQCLMVIKKYLVIIFEIYYQTKDKQQCEGQWSNIQKNQFQQQMLTLLKLILHMKKYLNLTEMLILLKHKMQIFVQDFKIVSLEDLNYQNIYLKSQMVLTSQQKSQQLKLIFDKNTISFQIQRIVRLANSQSYSTTVSLMFISAAIRIVKDYYARYPQDYFLLLSSYYEYKFLYDKNGQLCEQQMKNKQTATNMIKSKWFDYIYSIINSLQTLFQNQKSFTVSVYRFLTDNDFIMILENTLLMLYTFRFYIIDHCKRVYVDKANNKKENPQHLKEKRNKKKGQTKQKNLQRTQTLDDSNKKENQDQNRNFDRNKNLNTLLDSEEDSEELQYTEMYRDIMKQSQFKKIKDKHQVKKIYVQLQNKIFNHIKQIQEIKIKLANMTINIYELDLKQSQNQISKIEQQQQQVNKTQTEIFKINNELINQINKKNKKDTIHENEQILQILQGQQTRMDYNHEFQLQRLQQRKSKLKKSLKTMTRLQQFNKQRTVSNLVCQSYTNFYLRDYVTDIFVRQKYPKDFDVRQTIPRYKNIFSAQNKDNNIKMAPVLSFFQLQQDEFFKKNMYSQYFYEKMLRRQQQQAKGQPKTSYSHFRSNKAQSVYSNNLSVADTNGDTRTISSSNKYIFKLDKKETDRCLKYFPKPYKSLQSLKRLNFYHLQFLYQKSFMAKFPLSEFKKTKQIVKTLLIEYLQKNRYELYDYLCVLREMQINQENVQNIQKQLPSVEDFIKKHQNRSYESSFDQLLVYLIDSKLNKDDAQDCRPFFNQLRQQHTKLFQIIILFYGVQMIQNEKKDVKINYLRKLNLNEPQQKRKTNKSFKNSRIYNDYQEQQDIDIDDRKQQRQKRQPTSYKSNIQTNIRYYLQQYLSTQEFNELLKFSIMKLKISTSYTLKLYAFFYEVLLNRSVRILQKLNKALIRIDKQKQRGRQEVKLTNEEERQFIELFTSLKFTALLQSSFKCSIEYQYGSHIKNGINSLLSKILIEKNQKKYYDCFHSNFQQISLNSALVYYCTACEELNIADEVCVQPNRYKEFWCKYCHVGNLDRLQFSHQSIKKYLPAILYNQSRVKSETSQKIKTQEQKIKTQQQISIPTQYNIEFIKYNSKLNYKKVQLIRLLSDNRQLFLVIGGKIHRNCVYRNSNDEEQIYGERINTDQIQQDQLLFQSQSNLLQEYQKNKQFYQHVCAKVSYEDLDDGLYSQHPQIDSKILLNIIYSTVQHFHLIFQQI